MQWEIKHKSPLHFLRLTLTQADEMTNTKHPWFHAEQILCGSDFSLAFCYLVFPGGHDRLMPVQFLLNALIHFQHCQFFAPERMSKHEAITLQKLGIYCNSGIFIFEILERDISRKKRYTPKAAWLWFLLGINTYWIFGYAKNTCKILQREHKI